MKQSLNRSIALLEPAASALAPQDRTALLTAFRRYHRAEVSMAYLETHQTSREKSSAAITTGRRTQEEERVSAKTELISVLGPMKEDEFRGLLDGVWKEARKTARNFLRAFAFTWSASAAGFSISLALSLFPATLPAALVTPFGVAAVISGAILVSIVVAAFVVEHKAEWAAAALQVELGNARKEAGDGQRIANAATETQKKEVAK